MVFGIIDWYKKKKFTQYVESKKGLTYEIKNGVEKEIILDIYPEKVTLETLLPLTEKEQYKLETGNKIETRRCLAYLSLDKKNPVKITPAITKIIPNEVFNEKNIYHIFSGIENKEIVIKTQDTDLIETIYETYYSLNNS